MKKSMKSGKIQSGAQRARNPYLSFLFSLFFPGLGQIYNGDFSRGVIYYCSLTVIAFISPLYLTQSAEPSYLVQASFQCVFFIFVWLSSPVEGFFTAKLRGSITLGPLNSLRVYIPYTLVSAITTAITAFMATALFTIVTIHDNTMEPTFARSEILLCNNFSARSPRRGDTVLYSKDSSLKIGRILAKGGDTVAFAHNTFVINDIPLSLGVFTDTDRTARGLRNDPRLFSEMNGSVKYSVYHNIENSTPLIPKGTAFDVAAQHYFIAGDNRSGKPTLYMVQSGAVKSRVEGILAGATIRRFFQTPFITLPIQR